MEFVVAALWMCVLVQFVLFAALARQVGQLHMRLPPKGALVTRLGPEIGARVVPISVPSLEGVPALELIGAEAQRTLLLFVSPTCEVCFRVIPAAQALASSDRDLSVALLSLHGADHLDDLITKAGVRRHEVLDGRKLGMTWGISSSPHAVLVNERGVIVGKGIVNNREQIESLLRHDLTARSSDSPISEIPSEV